MVCYIADSDIHIMLYFFRLKRESISEIETEDRRHLIVVDDGK